MAVVKATAPKYFKGASNLTFRRRLWLSFLRKYGRIEKNATSFSQTWDVEYSEPEVRTFGDQGDNQFNVHDALQQLTVDIRGYTTTDKLTKKMRYINSGPEQIYNLYEKKSQNLVSSMRKKISAELYIDGNATGNEQRFLGIESFMGDDGNTAPGDLIANPSDSYAGQSTALGAITGSWTTDLGTGNYPNATLATDWPYGQGDTEYDFVSPKLINYSSTSWGAQSNSFQDNCEEVLRFAGIVCAALTDDEDVPYLHMLSSRLYNQFLNFYSAKGRIVLPHKESEDLGFSKTMNFEGAAVHFEYDCPSDTGYGICPAEMELFHCDDMLIVPDGPDWDIRSKAWLYEAGVFGNLRFQPKYFAKYKDYA